MRIRKWDSDGDMQAGHGSADYYDDDALGVAQAVVQRLRLLKKEWFLDLTDGTKYVGGIIGKTNQTTYDTIIKERILDTDGVDSIEDYESDFDGDTRTLTVTVTLNTEYGETTVSTSV